MKEENKEIVKKKEEEFQEALREYRVSGSKEARDSIFFLVFDACMNIAKSKANGIVINDLEEKALNATCKIFSKILEGENPRRLSSFCYLYVIGALYNKKTIRWERFQSFEEAFDNYKYYRNEENQIYVCSHNY